MSGIQGSNIRFYGIFGRTAQKIKSSSRDLSVIIEELRRLAELSDLGAILEQLSKLCKHLGITDFGYDHGSKEFILRGQNLHNFIRLKQEVLKRAELTWDGENKCYKFVMADFAEILSRAHHHSLEHIQPLSAPPPILRRRGT
jgi:hypothetical protein